MSRNPALERRLLDRIAASAHHRLGLDCTTYPAADHYARRARQRRKDGGRA